MYMALSSSLSRCKKDNANSGIAQAGGCWASLHVSILSSAIEYGSRLPKTGQAIHGTQVTYDPRDNYPETPMSPGTFLDSHPSDDALSERSKNGLSDLAQLLFWIENMQVCASFGARAASRRPVRTRRMAL
jgi:hypothetical protein